MDRIKKGELITLDDNKEYYVVDIVEQEDKRYLYLASEQYKEVIVAEEVVEGNDIIISALTNLDKMQEIAKIVLERLSN
jgi:hypothetical protein